MARFDYHTHTGKGSNIRLIDSICSVEGLIDRAIELNMVGVAITDHEALCSHPDALKYFETIKDEHPDFKLCLGNEIYLVDERPCDEHYHFILLAKDAIGHKQLRILSSLAWLNSSHRKGLERVDTLKSDLERIIKSNPGHLIASTACIGGELGHRILSMTAAEKIGDKNTAETEHNKIVAFMLWCKELFKSDFYIETQPGVSKDQIIVNQRLSSIAQCFDVKLTCTSDAHYLKKEDRFVHKSFLNSKEGEREVDAFYQDAYLHTDEEMIEKYAFSGFDKLFVEKMFANTIEIADKIENYTLFHPQQIPMVEVKEYPKTSWVTINGVGEDSKKYPILSSMLTSDDKIERYWVNECINKLYSLGIIDSEKNETYLSRLEEEARVKRIIGEKLGTNIFAYPVTLQYYINRFWELGSTVGAGRGSSCSGLNHYLLGVTQLDPIEWDLPFWRYLNEDRAELPDIDLDLAPSRRPIIINDIKKERGKNFYDGIEDVFRAELGCTLVATFGTESSKSAILTACRGYRSEEFTDGIDNDVAQYLSSLVPVERGFVWSIHDVYYGNPDKDRRAVPAFKEEVDQYPGLLDIMLGVEGLVSRRGSHASGVIFNDTDPFEFGAYMKTPSGDVITQYDLHDAEWCGATKYDFLVTEIQDKITQAIKFLQEDNQIEKDLTLKEVYDKYLHPSIIPIDDEKVWKAIKNVEILDLFQFDSAVGAQAAKKIQPGSMLELSDANGLMRLMTGGVGEEQPIDKYVRFKNNIALWYQEMDSYGLTKEEQEILKPHFLKSHGVPPSQEQLMTMLMDEGICGFSLKDANNARKIVGKKQMSKIPALHQQITDQAKSEALGKYVWDCGVGPQMGYSFSTIHALAYSFIAFQSAFIATKWNPIYWNTACLVVNSGSLENNDDEEIVSIYEKEDSDYEYEDLPDRSGKKKKDKSSDYAKIAKAIGNIISRGISVSLININESGYGFKPDVAHNRILYGLKALSNINSESIEKIRAGRPYAGIKDFMNRCVLPKTAMVNLIKAGAFDEIEKQLNSREEIMAYYLYNISEPKKKLNLQNFAGLISKDLVPADLEMQVRVFNFNKYIKTKKNKDYYQFDVECLKFFERFYSDYLDDLEIIDGIPFIKQKDWDKIYQIEMDTAREWLKNNQEEVLNKYNQVLFKEIWEKYAGGNKSSWEMDSLCFYHGPHELMNVDNNKYGIVDFNKLSSDPIVESTFRRGGVNIPIYRLSRIAGTVIAKDDNRTSVILLTTTGVVTVKFTRDYYSMFKKQISQKQPDGTKKVLEKSWFKRGNKLIIQGFRREDTFVAKNYKSTNAHQLYKITEIIGSDVMLQHERVSADNTYDEEEYDAD